MTTALRAGLLPRLRAEGISWRMVDGFLEVRIDLANESPEPTDDAELVIETAALGAFVPFKPGTRIAVAGLDPGERRRVGVRIPAERLGTATSYALADFYGALHDLGASGGRWAGNLNVYFDRAPEDGVEVHRALDLKVVAGRKVGFVFVLGGGGPYTMAVRSSDAAWRADIPSARPGLAVLAVTPPIEIAARARVEVRVTRTSDDKTVPVVFGMQTVAGHGDTLGCVQI